MSLSFRENRIDDDERNRIYVRIYKIFFIPHSTHISRLIKRGLELKNIIYISMNRELETSNYN